MCIHYVITNENCYFKLVTGVGFAISYSLPPKPAYLVIKNAMKNTEHHSLQKNSKLKKMLFDVFVVVFSLVCFSLSRKKKVASM